MDLELTDKVAIVTGAGRGIGFAVTEALRAEGARVVAGSRSFDGVERDGVLPVEVDLAAPDGPERLVAAALEAHGRVDILVNNVGGVHPRTEGFEAVGDDDFERSLQLNFFSALRTTRAVLADMKSRGEGVVVNVNSVNSFFEPDGGVIDYGVAKAALLNFAGSLSQELGPHGIRVTSVAPGPVATDLWLGDHGVAATVGGATGAGADAVREQAAGAMATGRFTTPREVAAIVALLASPLTANVTGANWVIDGGLVKTT
jgi:NAD(P)-dependent dehydrogenase (short-subunit alcohol dehydrogenase family)